MTTAAFDPWDAPVALALVVGGVWWLATMDSLIMAGIPGDRLTRSLLAPVRSALRLLLKEQRDTEVPDRLLWYGAPVLLMTAVMAALVVMPLAQGTIGADLSVGVVYFTAMFALVVVAVFAAGWGPDSKYPLIAGYRFIGLMLAYEMPFAITIIAVALPAQSLALGDIVHNQQTVLWNVILQPAGFLVYLVSALGVAFWGPFGMVTSRELAGGVEAEMSGAQLGLWRFGHYALLLAVSAFAVPLFLAGGAGPWLPPWAWSVIKVLLVASLLVATRHLLPRLRLDWFMKMAWIALIPISLVNLFLVGLLMLLFPGFFGKGG
jgi:NADH-quinone oxidoreductase subunit H